MKIPISWLKEFVDVGLGPNEIAHRLSMAGLEVETVENIQGDVVFTLGVTPNRGDCLSILGIARESAALTKKPFRFRPTLPPKGKGAIKESLTVKVLDSKACPRYMARVIRSVRIGPSPSWLQERLKKVALRPINNVVDCTNYCMWELGHPLHAFDLRFLRGKTIVVRKEGGLPERRRTPFKFTTLDGLERACEADDLFICDDQGPVALAGIMGGLNSEVREETQDIVLEAACFDPKQIHRTRQRLKLTTESAFRFERGVDPNGVSNALHRVTQLILETAGGMPTKDWIDVYPKKVKPVLLTLPLSEIRRHLGISLATQEVRKIFNSLGFLVQGPKNNLKIRVPTFRFDIKGPIDLVEELARLKGYDKIPETLPLIQMNLPQRPIETCLERIATESLLSLGYSEALGLSFTSFKKASIFTTDLNRLVPIANPLSEDHAVLRPSLIPALLDAAAFNVHRQRKNIKLFELKKVFEWNCEQVLEKKHLSLVALGQEWEPQWQLQSKPVDFFSLKGLLSKLAQELHVENFTYTNGDLPSFLVPHAGSQVYHRNTKIGWMGLLDPELLKLWEIETPVYALEIDWRVVVREAGKSPISLKSISKFPFVERDIALLVDQEMPVKKVLDAIWAGENPWIQKVSFFDLFKGGSLPTDKKSLAFNICYASLEKTLTNEEVNKAHEDLIRRLERELSAQLRT